MKGTSIKKTLANHPRLSGVLAILLCAVGYGLSPALVATSSNLVPGKGQVLVRAAITAAFLLAYLVIFRVEWKLVSQKLAGRAFVWFMTALPFGQVLFVIAVTQGDLAAGTTALFYLNASKVIITFLAKKLWLKEGRITRQNSLIVIAAVVALVVFAWPRPLDFSLAMLAAMGAGAIEAISSLSMGRLSQNDNRYLLSLVRYAVAILILAILLPMIGQPTVIRTELPQSATLVPVIALLVIGLNQAFIGRLEVQAYQLIDEDLANIVIMTELVWGTLFSILLIGDQINAYNLVGMGLLIFPGIAAGYLALRKKHRHDSG